MTGRYARDTTVGQEQSRAEIERTLTRYGADQFMYAWQTGTAVVGFRMHGRMVRFLLPLPDPQDPAFTQYRQGNTTYLRVENAARELYEKEARRRWRALALVVKAKLEAVETGITTFEDEFLAHIVLPDGRRVGEWMKPQVERAYLTGGMPPLLGPGGSE
jgi:hypothetical protein